MIVNKCPLKNIITNQDLFNEINKKVITVNKIVIQTYQFLNLFLIHQYESNKPLHIIDDIFIKAIIKTITKRQDTRGKPPSDETKKLYAELLEFYNKEYKKCITNDDIQDDTKLNFIMAYEAIDILKNIENNIKEHFSDYINRFVNVSFNKKIKFDEIDDFDKTDDEKKELKTNFCKELYKIKSDLKKLDNIEYDSDKQYHNWINEHRPNIILRKTFDKNSLDYDLCSHTQEYLKPLFYMNKQIEKINNENIKIIKPTHKLFQIIPQRTNIIGKYITIDTASLINMVIKKDSLKYLSDVELLGHPLWNEYFRTNKKEFKRKNYLFNHMIKTDGIGCSVLLIKIINGKPINITHGLQKKVKLMKDNIDEYIENVEITESMKNKRIVTIDPNMSDLIYCLSKTHPYEIKVTNKTGKIIKHVKQDENLIFRYTQNQRRLETRNKKYNKMQDRINKTTIINNKTIKEIETELSLYNSRTVNYDNFLSYCKKKNEINKILFDHYEQYIFRKLKLNRYINTQKSESKMIKNFKNKFGDSNNCLIIMGDHDQTENMKGKEPVICKRFRKIFRNNKYEVYLINEFRTSKLCNKCCSENEQFIKRKSQRPKDIIKNKIISVWGCLRCKNVNCKLIHNRDKNATLNMYKIVQDIFNGKGRPKEYCRSSK
jgi:hypothetical protein